MHRFLIKVEMTHKTDFTTADFIILKVVEKWKILSF